MKLFYLTLWQLIMIVVGQANTFDKLSGGQCAELRHRDTTIIQTLTLKVKINGKSKIINLVSTNQLLANEYLPVWISPPPPAKYYSRFPNVMKKDVGPFTMYHDYATRSAVVYFHNRREFDGIIDMMYKIEGLSIDKLTEEFILDTGYSRFLDIWKYFGKSNSKNKNGQAGIVFGDEKLRPKVYPELLIAISNDMIQAIEPKSKYPTFVKTICHVITVYNAVDMLFKFVQSADISVNIAAIVFEADENQWGFLSNGRKAPYVDAFKINDHVGALFGSKENIFRRHSFDYIVYHTRMSLLQGKVIPVSGVADGGDYEPVFMPRSSGYRRNIAVHDLESYGHYTTVAHELSHIFGAEHDRVFNCIFQNPSDRSVMAALGTPNLSLKWSRKTEKQLKRFFSSPAHCILRNEPQSLLPEDPRVIFTVEQQCQCYGYKSAKKELKERKHMCTWGFTCLDENGKLSSQLPLPMDGTPCSSDSNMVCWDKECVAVKDWKRVSPDAGS